MHWFVFMFLLLAGSGAIGILLLLDLIAEHYDEYRTRERIWQSIEIQSSRERHPSFQVSVFDQDAISQKGGGPNK